MTRQNSLAWRVRQVLSALGLLVIFACGGETGDPPFWLLRGPNAALVSAGKSVALAFQLESLNNNTSFDVTIAAKDLPAGWTMTPASQLYLVARPSGTVVDVPIQISVPANTTPGIRTVTIEGVDQQNNRRQRTVSITVGAAAATAIMTAPNMVGSADNSYEGSVEITNGEGIPIVTLLNARALDFTMTNDVGPQEALVWFRPKNGGFSVDPGDTDILTAVAIAMSNVVGRSYQFESFFNVGPTEYKDTSMFTVPTATEMAYTITQIDYRMGQVLADPDKTATYTVTLDPVNMNKAGLLTFSISSLPGNYTATITPPTVAVNANGDPVTVMIEVTRTGDSPEEAVDTFSFRATHDVFPELNFVLRLPIQNFLGR